MNTPVVLTDAKGSYEFGQLHVSHRDKDFETADSLCVLFRYEKVSSGVLVLRKTTELQ